MGGPWLKIRTGPERAALLTSRAEARRASQRKWSERNPHANKGTKHPVSTRVARVARLFKLSPIQWLALIYFQDHKCRCCKTADPGSKHGWHIDHDHVTGKVRGAVCHRCNTVLGMLGDQLDAVVASANMYVHYLETT